MISKIINSFFLGFIFVLLLDFLLFIGIKINYIDAYNIKVYYNTLFVDNQSYILFFVIALFFAYLISNKKTAKFFTYIYILLIFMSLSTLYKPIGKTLGKSLFEKENLSFKVGKITFKGNMLYKGRNYTYIYRNDIQKVVKLNNSELLQSK